MTHLDEAVAAQLATVALESARSAGARYVEARVVGREREVLSYRDGILERGRDERDLGIGIRALFDNGWGYAGTNVLTPEAVRDAARDATQAAKATARTARHAVVLPTAVEGRYETPLERDPFLVSSAEKAALMGDAQSVMLATDGVSGCTGSLFSQRRESLLWASNGSKVVQSVVLCGGGVAAHATANGDFQRRSAPKNDEGNVQQGGFEWVQSMGLKTLAKQVAREAVALTRAEPLPTQTSTMILGGAQLSLQIHESVGHPTELDRAFGEEISLAGASFLLPDALDSLRFGSKIVNLTADATTPHGPGTFGFDDEGSPATRTPLVKDGTFVGYLSGRDTAERLGRPTASALRAESWDKLPIVRMINVNLEPGSGSLDDLIGGVDDGVLIDTNRSWSIDDLRLNFQFSCEIAYEIKGGKRTGKIYKNPLYRGVTPKFWGDCSAIAGPEAWQMWGYLYCGKGDPVQVMYVGHGCAPARFDNVALGST
ncbi:MAG: TldD protein [Myxococcota bacterium]|jgi:TldD protein